MDGYRGMLSQGFSADTLNNATDIRKSSITGKRSSRGMESLAL